MTQSNVAEEKIENPDFLKQLVQTYLQEYLEQEMAHYLGAQPYERTQHRRGHRNGYKPRQLNPADGGGSPVWADCTYRPLRHVIALSPPSCLSVTNKVRKPCFPVCRRW